MKKNIIFYKKHLMLFISCSFIIIFLSFIGVIILSRDISSPHIPELYYNHPDILPENNAFTYFDKAGGNIIDKKNIEDVFYHQPRNYKLFKEIITINGNTFSLIEQGLNCKTYVPPKINSNDQILYHLSGYKTISILFVIRSRLLRYENNKFEALINCEKGLLFTKKIMPNSNTDFEALTIINCQSIILSEMHDIITDDPVSIDVLNEASRIINNVDLNLLRSCFKQSTRGMYNNHVLLIDSTNKNIEESLNKHHKYGKLISNYILKPNMTKSIIGDKYIKLIMAIDKKTYEPVYMDDIKNIYELRYKHKFIFYMHPNSYGYIILETISGINSFLTNLFRQTSEISALKTVIACLQYEKKYGTLPDTLNDLIPEFIDTVPQDPFDGKPMRYNKGRALIYSVGVGKVDHGGWQRNWGTIKPRWNGTKEEDYIMLIKPFKVTAIP